MDCRHIDRLLEANLEGRLSGFERMGLRQHLKSCRSCRAKVDAMTAFSESVEKTLATAAEGPDWRRLAPPVASANAVAKPARSADAPGRAAARPPAGPVRPRRRPWPPLGVAVVSAAIIAVVVPFWTSPYGTAPAAPWLEEAIAAEATRRAAGGGLDFVTDDTAAAAGWFDRRGLPALPTLELPAAVRLEGAFLTYYDGARVAGLLLVTPAGPLTVHLRPATRSPANTAGAADGAGLQALGAASGDWRAAVIGRPEAVEGSGIRGWLPAALTAPVDG